MKTEMTLSEDVKEVFKKLDRIQELREQIASSFPEYEYINALHDFRDHLHLGQRKLESAVETLRHNLTREHAFAAYADVKFIYFAIVSTHLSLENFLFEGAKNLRCKDDVDRRALSWKKLPESRIMKEIRNRAQHGAMLAGELKIEVRTTHHTNGSGSDFFFVLDESIWQKAVDKVPADAKTYYQDELQPQRDRLYCLVKKCNESLVNLIADVESDFGKEYGTEMKAHSLLKSELVETDEWLTEHGFIEPEW